MEIKKATIENLKDIQELNHQLCIKESEEFDPTINKDYPLQEAGEKYFKERIEKDDGCSLIAVADGKVVGYLVGAIIEKIDYRNISIIAEAENMLVLEEFRGKEIGKKLLQEFIRWARSKKAQRIRAVASAQNTRAIEFYRREGFKDHDLVLEKEL